MSIPSSSVHPLGRPVDRDVSVVADSPSQSAVSWAAIFAGAAGAASLSLILLVLGTGLGLATVSPWTGRGLGAVAFGASTIAWLTFTQLAASGIGGYLAGRLRTRWTAVHTDEVYFRDTAHGFLAWAVASLATAALLGSVVGSIASGGAQAAATVAGGAATAVTAAAGTAAAKAADGSGVTADPSGYFVDTLFRKEPTPVGTTAPAVATTDADRAAQTAEAARIFAGALSAGSLPTDDARYLGQLVAQRTGLAQADAEKRVNDTFVRLQTQARNAEAAAREAADKARKATALGSLWLAASLLIGAFVASLAATFGGRRRDL